MNPNLRARQRGISPVEILVGMAVSLLLLVGLGSMLVASRQASRAEQSLAQVQALGRFALDVTSRELRKAGYRDNRLVSVGNQLPAAAPFAAAAALNGTDNTLALRFVSGGDGFSRDCLGEDAPAGQTVVQTIDLVDGLLRCRAQFIVGGVPAAVRTGALAPSVEAVAFTYGVDDDGDLAADRYLSAAAVADWTQVTSVNLQLRVVSAEDRLVDVPQPYRDFAGGVVTPADRRLRRSISTVIALRNVLP